MRDLKRAGELRSWGLQGTWKVPSAAATRSKYGNKPTEYNGVTYHSAKEAQFAAGLDILVRMGELASWRRQFAYPLMVGEQVVCKIVVDFVLKWPDGTIEAVEVKGHPTAVWKLKWKWFAALYPDIKKRVE